MENKLFPYAKVAMELSSYPPPCMGSRLRPFEASDVRRQTPHPRGDRVNI